MSVSRHGGVIGRSARLRRMMQPRTDRAETIPPDEDAALLRLAEVLSQLQAKRAKNGLIGRALHFKGHAGVRAEIRTRDGLPAPYAVGIFAAAGTYLNWPASAGA